MFKFTEDGKKSYLNLEETLKKFDEIKTLISIQRNLLSKVNSKFAKDYIQDNLAILEDVKKNFEDQLSKDPEYNIMQTSDKNLKSLFNSNIVYIENKDQDKNCFDNFYD